MPRTTPDVFPPKPCKTCGRLFTPSWYTSRYCEPVCQVAANTKRAVTGCLEWTGTLWATGYGMIRYNRRAYKAHRFNWELCYGPIPVGLLVRHKCDNRRCLEPSHLELGTQADNMKDCVERGRASMGTRHPDSILNSELVRFIRQEHAKGRANADIGREIQVDRSIVRAVVVSWKHVPL
jgi:hypothetical protein